MNNLWWILIGTASYLIGVALSLFIGGRFTDYDNENVGAFAVLWPGAVPLFIVGGASIGFLYLVFLGGEKLFNVSRDLRRRSA